MPAENQQRLGRVAFIAGVTFLLIHPFFVQDPPPQPPSDHGGIDMPVKKNIPFQVEEQQDDDFLRESTQHLYQDDHDEFVDFVKDLKEKSEHEIRRELEEAEERKRQEYEKYRNDVFYDKAWRFFLSMSITLVVWCLCYLGLTPGDILHGLPLHKNITKITWPEGEGGGPLVVSNSKTIRVVFTNLQGHVVDHPLSLGRITVEVLCGHRLVPNSSVLEAEDGKSLEIIFNARQAGNYVVTLRSNQHCVRGFPTRRHIQPADVDPSSTLLHKLKSHTLVLTSGVPEDIKLDPRDKFGNSVNPASLTELTERITFQLWHINSGSGGRRDERVGATNFVVYRTSVMDLCISVAFRSGEEGWYIAQVQLDGRPIAMPDLSLIVLSRNERARVDRFIHNRKQNANAENDQFFEADIVGLNGQSLSKPRRVYVYLTGKQVIIREYFLRFFLKRAFTFRSVPATKLLLQRYKANSPVIRIEDGYQTPGPELCIRDGNILAACFHQLLLEKVGGSETFKDKQVFFYCRLITHHQSKGHRHSTIYLNIARSDIVTSSLRATKWYTENDWAKLFIIDFEGEPGIDQGGVRREWFEVLSKEIFSPAYGLFVQVEEGSSAVMPNPSLPQKLKMRMFKFAGKLVGKMLYESAHGQTYRQLLPVRLAKSFLAQLVGLRVHYRHFADDAPDFYASKIRLIENTHIEDPDGGLDDLTFTEEVENGARVVDLKPNGASIRVTEANKMEYLDRLAQYRLVTSVQEATDQFLEGLHSMVPDSLLSLFDESELELMLCGVREYNLADLRKNHVLVQPGLTAKTVDWFWLVLSHLTSEQFARLMQFTTGSSQLPPGGFADLRPKLQIASSQTRNSLPTAHTCFNMICLPEHSTFEDFEKALLTAITEGSEGFGLS